MPDGVKRGFLRLVDSQNNTLGQAEINLDNYIHVKEGDEILETQTLFAKQKKEGETPVAIADLKYTFLNGKYADFKARNPMMTSVMRALVPQ